MMDFVCWECTSMYCNLHCLIRRLKYTVQFQQMALTQSPPYWATILDLIRLMFPCQWGPPRKWSALDWFVAFIKRLAYTPKYFNSDWDCWVDMMETTLDSICPSPSKLTCIHPLQFFQYLDKTALLWKQLPSRQNVMTHVIHQTMHLSPAHNRIW